MPKSTQDRPTQTTTERYMTKNNLETLLQRLFPGEKNFNIRLREEKWSWSAPREVTMNRAGQLDRECTYSANGNDSHSNTRCGGQGTLRGAVRSTEGQFGKQVRGTIPKAREYNSCHLNNIMTALPRNYHPISSMCTFGQCFVDKVKEPVRIFEVGQNALSSGSTRSYQQLDVSTVDDLNAHFASTQSDCTCRVISICQRNSWAPLQITVPMMNVIASEHKIGSLFWEVASCFYERELDLEEIFCFPFSEVRSGSSIETSYTLKYPEYKPKDNRWAIRQTGIYHQYDTVTEKSLFILLSPTPSSKAQSEVENLLCSQCSETRFKAFQLHRVPFTAYFSAWREYIVRQESHFIPISDCLLGAFLNEPLSVGYDSLSALTSLETRLLQISTMLASATDTVDELCVFFQTILRPTESQEVIADLKNQRRRCIAYSRTASHLQQRVHTISGLLANSLLFRDQIVAKEQNKNIFQLNKSAVFLTTLGLFYLPSSFMATFFGMNFFAMNEAKSAIVATPMIWIFIISSAALTAVTFILYNWLLRRDNSTLDKLAPKAKPASEWNMKTIKKQLTFKSRQDSGWEDSKA